MGRNLADRTGKVNVDQCPRLHCEVIHVSQFGDCPPAPEGSRTGSSTPSPGLRASFLITLGPILLPGCYTGSQAADTSDPSFEQVVRETNTWPALIYFRDGSRLQPDSGTPAPESG